MTITGINTNFQPGDTVTVPSGMLAVSNVMVNSATSISATLTANANVVAGPQALVVTTGGQNLTLPLAIAVSGLRSGAVLSLSSVAKSGAYYTWSYNATFSTSLNTGDTITLYDVPGYAGSISVPANFSASVQLTGPKPSLVLVSDSSSLSNLTLTYTGPAIPLSSPMTVGFSFQSTFNSEATGYSSFQGSANQGVGSVTVPASTAGSAQNGPYGAFTVGVLGAPAAQGSGQYLTTYQVDNWSGAAFGTGSYITIFDVPGYISTHTGSSNWSCSYQLVGNSTPNTAPPDSSSVMNATCTYTGAAVPAGSAGPVASFTFLTDSGGPLGAVYYASEVFGQGSSKATPNNQVVGLVTTDTVALP